MPIAPARTAAFDILLRVAQEDAYAAELLHSPNLDKLSTADRGLATEIVMGTLRWQSVLDERIAAAASKTIAKLDAEVRTALRLATYQLLFLDRVPASAAVNDSVELVKRAGKRSAAPFSNAVLRKLAAGGKHAAGPEALRSAAEIARTLAHPAWLVERWAAQFSLAAARQICEHDQQPPVTSLRLAGEGEESELRADGIELAPGALLARARRVVAGDVTKTRAFREGRAQVQDEASQLVALLVGRGGGRILDCCAAPGGKTAAIAERNPQAEIVATDIHPHRARLLEQRVRAANVCVVTADARKLEGAADFDRVLADVPCSGTGTLARNPEIKWRLAPEKLAELQRQQVAILSAALDHVTPGGKLVYSTCSLECEEDEDVVKEVLAGRRDAELLDCRAELEQLRAEGELAWGDIGALLAGRFLRTIPGVHPCDGFFAALLRRT